MLICITLKETLSSGQKPVYNTKIVTSEQITFDAVVYFGQVFWLCQINKKKRIGMVSTINV